MTEELSEHDLDRAYGEDVTAAGDGTFSVSLAPWTDLRMEGFATRLHALRAAHVAQVAMSEYARDAMTEV